MTPALADPDGGLAQRLLAGMARRLAAREAPGLVLFGLPPGAAAEAAPGARVRAAFADPAALSGYRPAPGVVVLVGLDAFPDLAEAVQALLAFRARCPGTGVVLASAAAGGDDFGADRRAIGDVTLRLPLSARRLAQALATVRDRQG